MPYIKLKKQLKMNDLISNATKNNWKRIGTNNNKLKSRANKKLSDKNIVPVEYFDDKNNINKVIDFIKYIKENNYNISDVLYSLSIKLLKNKNILDKSNVKEVLKEYSNKVIDIPDIPLNERDILGIVYQSFINEGNKNIKGSYYTPKHIIKDMVSNIDFNNKTFLDPCCGSGSFILELVNIDPKNIYGFDNDPIAVFICKVNLLLKYYNYDFIPNIFCLDFLSNNIDKKFDYIITNPPWGSNIIKDYNIKEIKSKESSSLFFVKSFEHLNNNGTILFLLPEAILNVKVHKDVRNFMLSNGLSEIKNYGTCFNGVFTNVVSIKCIKGNSIKPKIINNNIKNDLYLGSNNSFLIGNNIDTNLIKKIKSKGKYYLDKDCFALGIVTGNNKEKIKKEKINNEHTEILVGKDINKYTIKKPSNYIIYDPKNFQQIAKKHYYFSEEKLLYKFISNNLCFGYDNNKTLVLNSANIIIPKIPNMSIKTMLAFLNSNIFNYYYKATNKSLKVLKGNLMLLPFPEINNEMNKKLDSLVSLILKNRDLSYDKEIQNIIYSIFELTSKEIEHIEEGV